MSSSITSTSSYLNFSSFFFISAVLSSFTSMSLSPTMDLLISDSISSSIIRTSWILNFSSFFFISSLGFFFSELKGGVYSIGLISFCASFDPLSSLSEITSGSFLIGGSVSLDFFGSSCLETAVGSLGDTGSVGSPLWCGSWMLLLLDLLFLRFLLSSTDLHEVRDK